MQGPGHPSWGSLESETVTYDFAGEGQQQLYKDYESNCSVENILVVGLKGVGAKMN
jgi:hypothetical protein